MGGADIKFKDLEHLTEVLRGQGIEIVVKDGAIRIELNKLFSARELIREETELEPKINKIISELQLPFKIQFGLIRTSKTTTEVELFFQRN